MDTVSVKMVSEENEKKWSGSFEKNREYSMESVHKQFFFMCWDASKKWISEHSEQVVQMLHVSLKSRIDKEKSSFHRSKSFWIIKGQWIV